MNLDTLSPLLLSLLILQGIIGGFDTLFNHELVERLPYRPEAHNEIGLHAMREAIYGTLFCGLAWFTWHGATAWIIAALLFAELIVTTSDEYVENHTRVLPQNERVLHVLLTVNYGVLVALLLPVLVGWHAEPGTLIRRDSGWWSWLLTAFGIASLGWSVRDLFAWRRLRRQAQSS